jgi:hypothetical protein
VWLAGVQLLIRNPVHAHLRDVIGGLDVVAAANSDMPGTVAAAAKLATARNSRRFIA